MKHTTIANISITFMAVIIGITPSIFPYSNAHEESDTLNTNKLNCECEYESLEVCDYENSNEESYNIPATYNITLDEYDEADIVSLSKMLYGEADGVLSETERAAVVWCCLNRFDNGEGQTISACASNKDTFNGYDRHNPVTNRNRDLVEDVLYRYYIEKAGAPENEVLRVLPNDYLWFLGDGERNHFRNNYEQTNRTWNWSLESPYST